LLKEIYFGAIREHKDKIAQIKDSDFGKILSEASSRWICYEPSPTGCTTAGVDSSWNKRAFQGLDLYVVDAAAVTAKNEVLASEWETNFGLARSELLEQKAMSMEMTVLEKASRWVDIVCVDGSLVPRIAKSSAVVASETLKVATRCSNAIFVSKTSDSRIQFANLNSKAGDIYYFNHATKSPGFSRPVKNMQSGNFGSIVVVEFYARIKEHTPIIKVQTIISDAGEQEIKRLLDMLCYRSVAGYPYCLRLAHDTCKISNEDIDRLASIYGLQNEPGAREVLNE
jgi:hypothetical protein